jgi:protein-histidine pros-kinase
MFGHTREELLGAEVDMLVPEEIRGGHANERKGFMERPRVRPMGAGMALSALHKDGHQFRIEINLAPYQAPDGLFVVAAIRDVAAQKGEKEEGG